MKKDILEYSYQNNLSHIPSALSMLDYIDVLFTNNIVVPIRDKIVIGKPFGAQAYYLIWKKLGYLDNIEHLSVGVKHDEIEFVDFSEETMGNALGVAIGIALATPNTRVWVNLTDASLQMGNTLEAIQFIGHNNISNIFVTVDYNNAQVTGTVDSILTVNPVINLCKDYGWIVQKVSGHDHNALKTAFNKYQVNKPNIIFCFTIKGYGIKKIEEDIKAWHYKKIETLTELQSLVQELRVI